MNNFYSRALFSTKHISKFHIQYFEKEINLKDHDCEKRVEERKKKYAKHIKVE